MATLLMTLICIVALQIPPTEIMDPLKLSANFFPASRIKMPRVVLGDERTNFAYHPNYHCAYHHTGSSGKVFAIVNYADFLFHLAAQLFGDRYPKRPRGHPGNSSFLRVTKKIPETEMTSPREDSPTHAFRPKPWCHLHCRFLVKYFSCFLFSKNEVSVAA